MNSVRKKIDLYILSLALLFVFLFILSIKFDYYGVGWKEFAKSNVVPIVLVVALLYCLFAYSRFNFELNGSCEIPFEIRKIENINYENLIFLNTYIVPLISFDVGQTRFIIVLCLLLFLTGVIYIKTNYFYLNPSLALLGFRIYRANGHFKHGNKDGLILICRNECLIEKQKVVYIKLDDCIYYVKGIV